MLAGALLSFAAALRPPLARVVRGTHVRACIGAGANDAASIALAEQRCSPEPPAMAALREETRTIWPGGVHMVSGAQQGRLLHTLVRLARAPRVLEVGCFTGYAALWMALALPEGGRLLSLERDERCAAIARKHLESSGVGDRVDVRIGDALESLAALGGGADGGSHDTPFDLAVWHCGRETSQEGGTPCRLLQPILDCMGSSGVLVLVQDAENCADAALFEAIEDDGTLKVVALPAPHGEGGLVSLVIRSDL